ncbi:S1 family peptidase [Saccharopolyspora cebuensis]|uniref:S1 family peptidase n=1 Tax=Saccharopolyspora cebuensis TaxID=418759 RepID=A0ABV4CR64_9PSEU
MRRTLAARIAGSVVLAAGTVIATTMPATATTTDAPTPTTADAPAVTMLDAMQRDLGLDRQQAQTRIDQESVANRANEVLREALGADFGGSHFDAQRGKLVVGVTDAAQFDVVRDAGAAARLVDHTVADLGAVVDGLNADSGQAPASVTGWYADTTANTVVLTTKPGTAAEAERFVEAAEVDGTAVDVVESEEAPRALADVIGGNAYYTGGGGRCSIGFSVQGGFVTAGHCGSVGTSTSQPSGTVAGSSFPGNDYGFVRTSAGETPRPLVNNYRGGTVGVSGSTESAVGSSICRSGSTTGWHCGTVEAKNQTVRYSQGAVYGLTRTNVCAEPGDSGGSWLTGSQAQGVTSGGSGNCTWGGTTYFQPVNEILNAYGLRLLTQ